MLGEKRISEAENNVKTYLEDGLVRKIARYEENVFNTFKRNCEDSLRVANLLFEGKHSYLWTVVCSYYSMYYISNAVIYKLGYKVGSKVPHKVTADALIVFVRKKLKQRLIEEFEEAMDEALELAGVKTDELIQSFDFERVRRSRFQYEMTEEVKKEKARVSLERAKRFVFEMEKLLV